MTEAIADTLKIRCDREDLLSALQAADAVVPSTSAKPILTNLQLTASDTELEIAATDMQVGLRAVLRRLEVATPGQVVVPARSLVGILKESRSASVLLAVEALPGGVQLRLDLEDGGYCIPAVMGEAFPPVTAFPNDEARVTVPGPDLERMLRKTAFAVDRDRASAVLSGVHLSVDGAEFILAATDGKVLAENVYGQVSLEGGSRVDAILPAATVSHLSRIVSAAKPKQVEIAVAGKLVFVRVVMDSGAKGSTGSIQIELTSRLVEGTYPAYRNALPSTAQGKITFSTDLLSSAVRRTALMTSSASRGIVLEASDNQAVLSNLNNSSGSARIPVPCTITGYTIRFGLNAQYVSEILRAYEGDEITFEMNGPGKGLIVRESTATYLIMPITLPN